VFPNPRAPVVGPTTSAPRSKRAIALTMRVIPNPNLPERLTLEQNFPNPCTGSTTIRYAIPRRAPYRIEVFNITGQRVATLVSGVQEPGAYAVRWNAQDDRGARLRAGVYFYRASSGSWAQSRKIVIQ
jgi:hypothetical protein